MNLVLEKKGSTVGAALLVTGCCVGAGMIGLPIVSQAAGFSPSALAMLLCYCFTTATGLLLLEATLWFKEKVHLLTLAEFTLNKPGKYVTGALFLFLFYCLSVAYLDGGGDLFASAFGVSRTVGILLFTLLIYGAVSLGTKKIDHLNRIFITALAAVYLTLVFRGLPTVDPDKLLFAKWSAMFPTIPILLICFGYQNLVPSLVHYLNRNVNSIRFAIIGGNLIPFLIYLIWNYVLLGNGDDLMGSAGFLLQCFTFLALITSFLPSAVSFVDFLKDGTNIKTPLPLVLIPPMLFTLFNADLFLKALGFAGGFVDVLLFGMLPVCIVFIGRKKLTGPYKVKGGNFLLAFVFLAALFVFIMRCL